MPLTSPRNSSRAILNSVPTEWPSEEDHRRLLAHGIRDLQIHSLYWASVRDFGAVGDGVTDDRAAIQAAFDSGRPVRFTDSSTYYVNGSITRSADNVDVDLGTATVSFDGTTTGFLFGAAADTPSYNKLRFTGGTIKNFDSTDTDDRQFVRVGGYQDVEITNIRMENVSNGGVHIQSGCKNVLVEDIKVVSWSSCATLRGIWLNGSGHSTWSDTLINISTIGRNATALPTAGVENATVRNCRVPTGGYPIYTDNAHDCTIENNYLDITGSGLRCITINTYSPRTKIRGNTLVGTVTAHGVFLTQFSRECIIEGNIFRGSFGSGADIKIAYLSRAIVRGNIFNTTTTANIVEDMGGSAVIEGNDFAAPSHTSGQRPLRIYTIEETLAGTSTYGDTATLNPGSIFRNNMLRNRTHGVQITQQSSSASREPGLQYILVYGNVFENMDLAGGTEEWGLFIEMSDATYPVYYAYYDNTYIPYPEPNKNIANNPDGLAINVRRELPEVVRLYDDFLGDVLADEWNGRVGTDAQCVAPAILADQTAGYCRLVTGNDAAGTMAANGVQLESGRNWLVGEGETIFETSLKLSSIATMSVFVGFTDQNSALEMPFLLGGGDALTSNATDAVGVVYSTDATTGNWFLVGVANDVDATKQNTGVGPTAGNTDTWRIRIGSDGVAQFYHNGHRIGTEMSGAVRTTVQLTPIVAAFSTSTASRNIDVDYLYVQENR